ncbi:MAG: hypothetical protein AAFN13_08640 [Bacteroidota bacterium]
MPDPLLYPMPEAERSAAACALVEHECALRLFERQEHLLFDTSPLAEVEWTIEGRRLFADLYYHEPEGTIAYLRAALRSFPKKDLARRMRALGFLAAHGDAEARKDVLTRFRKRTVLKRYRHGLPRTTTDLVIDACPLHLFDRALLEPMYDLVEAMPPDRRQRCHHQFRQCSAPGHRERFPDEYAIWSASSSRMSEAPSLYRATFDNPDAHLPKLLAALRAASDAQWQHVAAWVLHIAEAHPMTRGPLSEVLAPNVDLLVRTNRQCALWAAFPDSCPAAKAALADALDLLSSADLANIKWMSEGWTLMDALSDAADLGLIEAVPSGEQVRAYMAETYFYSDAPAWLGPPELFAVLRGLGRYEGGDPKRPNYARMLRQHYDALPRSEPSLSAVSHRTGSLGWSRYGRFGESSLLPDCDELEFAFIVDDVAVRAPIHYTKYGDLAGFAQALNLGLEALRRPERFLHVTYPESGPQIRSATILDPASEGSSPLFL